MRVANYYRVSTKLQENRFSLSAQKTELHSYAEKQGWKVTHEFKDVDLGGKFEKEGLTALLDAVESAMIDVVLVMDQDRLSRLDTLSWEFLKSVLRENDVKIAEPNGTLTDLTNEDDVFISDLKNLLAQREKKKIVKRMMYGKRQRLREGKGWGVPPLEYYYKDGFYHAKDEWRWVIPFIDDLYINKNMGMLTISNELNKVSKTPSGRNWNEHLVHTRLTSKNFHGIQEMTFENGETISAEVFEPMRTEETYNKIQEIRKRRAGEFSVATRVSNRNIGLLKYVPITCGRCGRVLSVQQQGTVKYPKYITVHGRQRTVDGSHCDIFINAKRYEYNMIKALFEILTNEDLSKKYIQFENNETELAALKKSYKQNKKTFDKLQLSKDKLLDLYLSDMIDKQSFADRNEKLETQIKVSAELVNQIDRKIKLIKESEWNYENLMQYLEIAEDFGTALSRHEQAKVISNLFIKAILHDDKLILTTEVFNSVPVDITIPVTPSTKTVNKWIRRDARAGRSFYTP